jgi:hypothetical protein
MHPFAIWRRQCVKCSAVLLAELTNCITSAVLTHLLAPAVQNAASELVHFRQTSAARRRRLRSARHHPPKHQMKSTHAKRADQPRQRAQTRQKNGDRPMRIDQSTTMPRHGRGEDYSPASSALRSAIPSLILPSAFALAMAGRDRLSPPTPRASHRATARTTGPQSQGCLKKLRVRGEGSSGSSLTDTPEGPPHNILNS